MMKNNQAGFTLIEIIITLALGAILGAMLIPFLSTALTKSGMSTIRLKETLNLQTTMENITADYRHRILNGPDSIATLKVAIGTEGETVSTGYGSYHVLENHYIDFADTEEVTDTPGTSPQDTLKVTIRDSNGMIFTTLFSKEL